MIEDLSLRNQRRVLRLKGGALININQFHLFECRSCKRKFVTPFFANFHIKEGLCKKEEGELCDDGGPALNVVDLDTVEFSSFCRLQNAITKCTGLMLHELQYGEEDLLKCACFYRKGPDSPDSPEPIIVEERQMQTSPPATDPTSSATVTSFPATSQTSTSKTDAKDRQSVENCSFLSEVEKQTFLYCTELLALFPDGEKLTVVSDDEEQSQGPDSPDSPEPTMLEEHQMRTLPSVTDATSSAIMASFPAVSQTCSSMMGAKERQSIEKYGEKLTVVSDDEMLTLLPDEEKLTVVSDDGILTLLPVEGKLTVVSDDEMLTLLPDEEKLTVVSDDEMLTLLPDEGKLTIVSDDEEQAQSSDVPKVDVGAERSLMATSNTLVNATPSRRALLSPPCTSTNVTSCPTSFE
uniref:C2H2-type domain-containing protein n=1 Tax=Angiostrongylus cantonensis TaxID=6313 RepID=A0A0K0DD04_ANGCA